MRVLRLKANEYVHVLDNNTCDVLTLLGPLCYTLREHHTLLHHTPQPCVVVPPGYYVVVHNPVTRHGPDTYEATTATTTAATTRAPSVASVEQQAAPTTTATATAAVVGYELVTTQDGLLRRPTTATAHVGSKAYRFAQRPFALFPGERATRPQRLPLLAADEALVLRVKTDFVDRVVAAAHCHHRQRDNNNDNNNNGNNNDDDDDDSDRDVVTMVQRRAGDEYLFRGPGLYYPHVRESVTRRVRAWRLQRGDAVHVCARYAHTDDVYGVARVAGEEWQVDADDADASATSSSSSSSLRLWPSSHGLYFAPPACRVVRVLRPHTLTRHTALCVQARIAHYDARAQRFRAAHSRWLVTYDDAVTLATTTSTTTMTVVDAGLYTPRYTEDVVGEVAMTVLFTRQYALVTRCRDDDDDGYGNNNNNNSNSSNAAMLRLDAPTRRDGNTPLPQRDDDDDTVMRRGHDGGSVASATATSPSHATVRLHVGPCTFFLQPGECLVGGVVHDALVLERNEAVLVEATTAAARLRSAAAASTTTAATSTTATTSTRDSHDEANDNDNDDVRSRWLVRGPRVYVPDVHVRVCERRRVLPLHPLAGVYVRNTHSGHVRSVVGQPLLLDADEELWQKPLSPFVRLLLRSPGLSVRATQLPALLRPHGDTDSDNDDNDNDNDDKDNDRDDVVPTDAAYDDNNDDNDNDDDAMSDEATTRRRVAAAAVVTARLEPHTLARVVDASTGNSRVEVGPATVLLAPHEHLTLLTLSGGRPKRPAQIYALRLFLGPDYAADVVDVETRDHARWRLRVAYTWQFDTRDMARTCVVAFAAGDFIRVACKALASRIRARVARQPFAYFHRHSLAVVRAAVFGRRRKTPHDDNEDGGGSDGGAETATRSDNNNDDNDFDNNDDNDDNDNDIKVEDGVLHFAEIGLRVTNVEVERVDAADGKTRLALMKSVQLAVDIITRTQESAAMHRAMALEQRAAAARERQLMRDKAAAEDARVALLRVVARNAAVEQCGASAAQARAEARARECDAQAERDVTPLRCRVHTVAADAEHAMLRRHAEVDLAHRAAMHALAVARARELADVAAHKYEQVMAALGTDTLLALAQAGPALQARLLTALGLRGYLVMDGTAPINLLHTARQLTATTTTTATAATTTVTTNNNNNNNSNNSDNNGGSGSRPTAT